MVFFDFKMELNQKECRKCLKSAYENEAPSHASSIGSENFVEFEVFTWMKNMPGDPYEL